MCQGLVCNTSDLPSQTKLETQAKHACTSFDHCLTSLALCLKSLLGATSELCLAKPVTRTIPHSEHDTAQCATANYHSSWFLHESLGPSSCEPLLLFPCAASAGRLEGKEKVSAAYISHKLFTPRSTLMPPSLLGFGQSNLTPAVLHLL